MPTSNVSCGLHSVLQDVLGFTTRVAQVYAGIGTSSMIEVFINQEPDPYVLEVDGRLDLAALQLQPASIVMNRSATNPP